MHKKRLIEMLQSTQELFVEMLQIASETIRESLAKFENRIMPRVYVRRATHITIYEKSSSLLARTGVGKKNSNEASGSSHIKTHYSDYPKRFINRISEVIAIFY